MTADIPQEAVDREWIGVEELRALIKARFAVRGQPTQFAATRRLTDEVMLGFLRGARPPADDLLATLGWERQIFYRRVGPCGCYSCTKEHCAANPPPPEKMWLGGLVDGRMQHMFLCETCGNKRCPHAHDHRNACTGSNEPGQAGSGYENVEAPSLALKARAVGEGL